MQDYVTYETFLFIFSTFVSATIGFCVSFFTLRYIDSYYQAHMKRLRTESFDEGYAAALRKVNQEWETKMIYWMDPVAFNKKAELAQQEKLWNESQDLLSRLFPTDAQASPWQINFQDPATPIADRIIEIHHHVFFFLVIVLIFVSWMLFRVLVSFWYNIPDNKAYSLKDLNTMKMLSKLKFTHNTTIEIIWTSIPSLILVAIAIPSFGLLYAMDDVIDPEVTIKAIGHQWYWSYEYSDYHLNHGTISFDSYMIPESDLNVGQLRLLEVDNSVVLPMGVYIRLNVSAADVLHCWAVPSLGIKVDAVPHRINSGVIFLQRLGTFYGQCSEICGVNHGFMPIAVKSVTLDKYLEWINNKLAE